MTDFELTASSQALVVALAGQVLLTLVVLILMGRQRVPAVMRGEVSIADIAVARDAYPLKARLYSNSFDNQFQLPVLFYVGALLALQLGGATALEAGLAIAFLVARLVHAAIHVTSNNVPRRFIAFFVGILILTAFWLALLARVLFSGIV